MSQFRRVVRPVIALCFAALLGGCVVAPWDGGYHRGWHGGGGHGWHEGWHEGWHR